MVRLASICYYFYTETFPSRLANIDYLYCISNLLIYESTCFINKLIAKGFLDKHKNLFKNNSIMQMIFFIF